MCLPGVVSGVLISRLGVVRMMLAGVAGMLATVVFALHGHEVMHYWFAVMLPVRVAMVLGLWAVCADPATARHRRASV